MEQMQTAKIVVRMSRGKLCVYATGRTGRGQRFIKAVRELNVTSISDKNFKAEMSQAVTELLESGA
jgi:hypothetical protein